MLQRRALSEAPDSGRVSAPGLQAQERTETIQICGTMSLIAQEMPPKASTPLSTLSGKARLAALSARPVPVTWPASRSSSSSRNDCMPQVPRTSLPGLQQHRSAALRRSTPSIWPMNPLLLHLACKRCTSVYMPDASAHVFTLSVCRVSAKEHSLVPYLVLLESGF